MFEAHGEFKLKLHGNILVSKFLGSWNKETAVAFVLEARRLVKPLNGKPWAVLTDLDEWELGTPECEEIQRASVIKSINKGLKCEALINRQGHLKVEWFLKTAPQDSNFERRVFAEKQEGLDWLAVNGFTVDLIKFP